MLLDTEETTRFNWADSFTNHQILLLNEWIQERFLNCYQTFNKNHYAFHIGETPRIEDIIRRTLKATANPKNAISFRYAWGYRDWEQVVNQGKHKFMLFCRSKKADPDKLGKAEIIVLDKVRELVRIQGLQWWEQVRKTENEVIKSSYVPIKYLEMLPGTIDKQWIFE